ncbi:MAG: hypothetical protein MRY74_12405 [Neomegalonema sp.]|nr:hypothetical protein [Neomegalonema sp.]
MTQSSFDADRNEALRLISQTVAGRKRALIGLAGPAGSGKSTLAAALVAALNDGEGPGAALVPMDGFHLDNRILAARNLSHRKGAPETFDAAGFVAALRRLRMGAEDVYLPDFDRPRDIALAGAIVAEQDTPIIVVEGSYLFLDQPPWRDGAPLFDLRLFLRPPLEVLEQRLRRRWRDLNLSETDAQTRVQSNDLPNAQLVLSASLPPDAVLGRSANRMEPAISGATPEA